MDKHAVITGAARIGRPYCLRCYLTLERTDEALQTCPRCGFRNLEIDQQLYWTQERWLRELEHLIKAGIVVFIGGIALLIWQGASTSMHLGTGQGWVAGLPIVLGAVLWDTASKITRRDPYFRPGLLWSLILGILGLPVLLMGLGAVRHADARHFFLALAILACGILMLGLAVGAAWFEKRYERWQTQRILRQQEPLPE